MGVTPNFYVNWNTLGRYDRSLSCFVPRVLITSGAAPSLSQVFGLQGKDPAKFAESLLIRERMVV